MELPFLHKANKDSGLCSIYLMPDSVHIAYVTRDKESRPHLNAVATKPYSDLETLKLGLEELIKQYQLQKVKSCWVMHSDSYQLLILDKPAVDESEIIPALRWQLKKTLAYPVEQALITYFDLPLPPKVEGKEEIFVAVAERDSLQKKANLINQLGFELQYIDIAELALRNLNALYGDDEIHLGLLLLKPTGSSIIITHQKELLLTRSIPISLDLTEEVALEIQRSFVFCQNQQQQIKPKKLLIAPENPEIANYLSSQLEIEAEALPIKTFFNNEQLDLANLTHEQIIAVAGALRGEGFNNATN